MIDECPACGSKDLKGFDNFDIIICFKCEWAINKTAWLNSWNN